MAGVKLEMLNKEHLTVMMKSETEWTLETENHQTVTSSLLATSSGFLMPVTEVLAPMPPPSPPTTASPSGAGGSSSALPMVAGGVGGALLLAALGGFCWWKTRKGHNSQVTCNNSTIMSPTHIYPTKHACIAKGLNISCVGSGWD
jgi:hypothetical protein